MPLPACTSDPVPARPASRLQTCSLAGLEPLPNKTAHAILKEASRQSTLPVYRMTRTLAVRSQSSQSTVDGDPDKSGNRNKLPLDFGRSLRESEFLFDPDYRQ